MPTPFTIAKLAEALRGMPRSATLHVRLPDGTEVPVVAVTGRNVTVEWRMAPKESVRVYEVVLLVEEGGSSSPDTAANTPPHAR